MHLWIKTGLALAILATPASAEEVVNIYNWSDYIDESILTDFTAETGIKIRYDVFDSNEMVEAKLLAGATGYDIVVPTAYFLSRQIRAGVFAPLDKSKLPNFDNLWTDILKRTDVYDPGAEYAIPYMWGTTGLGYVKEKIEERMPDAPVNSWDMLFDVDVVSKFKDCGVFVLDAPTDMLPIAMNYLGLDPDSKEPDDIKKGAELLTKIRPYVQKFDSSEYINALANGDICLAVGWSGDVLQARDRAEEADNGVTVVYSIPKEGTMMWFDMMAIPADAPNKDNALTFLNYIMKPEVIAKATNYVNYANANKASQEFVDEAVLDDPAVYPPQEVVEKLFTTTELPPRVQRVATREWTRVKTGQ
ncbi:spermidine/putrescine ABC transporter substrate-binding protein PotF [Acuticoccus sediminis]|uniref:Putrescine-binding periplasmic protein n=1 Tax=Acuticoccus sediminis TaxID=2184697 RepID=A0A8B2NRC9_9HYPH|nr:polyamine ABC transporter substrate-binding protein [Acuticoccus sediminis]RAH97690.1 spermidine/putrescine ABC transporter substrate-binding protein PotF [Acuticoccus sediminis]